MIYIRTYYLFKIKNEFYDIYNRNPYSLYKTLENLYLFKNKDFNLGISLFTQLCEFHNVDLLEYYFSTKKYPKDKNKYILKNRYETTTVYIRPSVIKIVTNKNNPNIFKILNYYSPYIFVIDFNSKDYFWLKNTYSKI